MAIVQYYIADDIDDDHNAISTSDRIDLGCNNNYSAYDDYYFDLCIKECANNYYYIHGGHEYKWPCFLMLWIDDQYLGMFEVELEHEPVFSAKKVE